MNRPSHRREMHLPRVLIVDDEETIRLTLQATLATMDVQAETARNGDEALSMLE